MALEVRLPRFSEEMKEGTVTRWLKAVGDPVAAGEPIAEVETEKVIVEVEAPRAGVLLEIRAAEQTVVAVDGVLCRIGEPGELSAHAVASPPARSAPARPAGAPLAAAPLAAAPPAAAPPAAASRAEPARAEPARAEPARAEPARAETGRPGAPASNVVTLSSRPAREDAASASAARPALAAEADAAARAVAGPAVTGHRAGARAQGTPMSPLARRVAAELGVDPTQVRGTGIGGKIVVSDLDPYLAAQQPAAGRSGSARGAPPTAIPALAGAATADAAQGEAAQRDTSQGEAAQRDAGAPPEFSGVVEVPHSPLRKAVARRMAESKATIPHFYMTAAVDATELLALRARLNSALPAAPLSLNDLLLKATALALREEPALNAEYGEQALRRHEAVHLAFAVATDAGLYTPVVRDCHLKSVGAIARDTQALVAKAKARSLAAEDLRGGTFTVSNLGMYDVLEFSAIINPPQVAILAVARPQERPVAVNGRVIVRAALNVTVSADHRALDGVTVAKFLQAFRAVVEAPERLLM